MPHDLNLTGLKSFLAPSISTSPPDATSTPARSQRTLQAPSELQERAPRQASPERSHTAPRTDLSQKLKVFAQLNRDDLASKKHVGSASTKLLPERKDASSAQPEPVLMHEPPEKAALAPTPAPATTPIPDDAAQIAAIRAAAAAENMINQANREAKVATMGLKAAKDIIG